MADSFIVATSGTLTTANATLYTVTAAGTLLLSYCSLANKGTANCTAYLTLNSINIVPGHVISANNSLSLPVKGALVSAGATISGYAGLPTSIDYYICGDSVT